MKLQSEQITFIKKALGSFDPYCWKIEMAGQAASQRKFIRISKENVSKILMVWDSSDQGWKRFLGIASELNQIVPYLPHIFSSNASLGLILEQDLGDFTLKKICTEYKNDQNIIKSVYMKVIDALFEWQQIDYNKTPVLASQIMDDKVFLWETQYFAEHCVKEYFGLSKLLSEKWEKQRLNLAREATRGEVCCIHRDFQSENILLHEDNIKFVDFQGARLGPPYYDLASLLLDPYIDTFDKTVLDELNCYYMKKKPDFDNRQYLICSVQRLMQALGAYCNLSLNKGKKRYTTYIPIALARLEKVLCLLPEYTYICRIVRECISKTGVRKVL
ncbi:phosphotransferase [Chitinispirillales bacterium ANBcel5]|uniref:phosphotransferase n=1 Tax=Cellulosispirillum alkaliphilum TaxID=3039283 RepID=UPI002A531636|nr:phosphotransferase [Chitinispirillales bacterium ANBcel5]